MNEKKAKKLRKEIYGDTSLWIDRNYIRDRRDVIRNHPESLRAKYQAAKRS